MPQFFFDLHDDRGASPDDTGLEMTDGEVASREAVAALWSIGKERTRTTSPVTRISVRDAQGRVIFAAALTLFTEPAAEG